MVFLRIPLFLFLYIQINILKQMKTVLAYEYKLKKHIADNLEKSIQKRYIEISDAEYERINTAIQTYSNSIEETYDQLKTMSFTEPQKNQLLLDLEKLEADIQKLKQDSIYTAEDGLYFTDENGNIAAKLDSNGLRAVNIGVSSVTSDITASDY